MVYDRVVKQDGQIYQAGDDVPELGSIRCVEAKGNIRSYEGLSEDVSKLPKYVETGSSFLTLDTGELYKYEKTTDRWYKI